MAQPAIVRVGVPAVGAPRFALALDGGYGYLETIHGAEAAHGRVLGQLAIGARVVDWLALSLASDVSHDFRPSDARGTVDATGSTRLALRVSQRAARGAGLGFEVQAFMPGGTGLTPVPAGTSVEAQVLSGFDLGPRSLLAASIGLRLDRSAHAIDRPGVLSASDRIAVGASEFNALLVGVGVSHRIDATELLCELGADMLVGTNARLLASSPLRADLGARVHFGEVVQLQVLLETSLSARPGVAPQDPLLAIEPRVGGVVGVRLAWPPTRELAEPSPEPEPAPAASPASSSAAPASAPTAPPTSPPAPAVPPAPAEEKDEAGAAPDADAPIEAAAPAGGETPATANAAQLRGHIQAFSGAPLRATITVYPSHLQASTDEQGDFQLDVPPGRYTVRLRAHGYKSQSRKVKLEANGVTVLNVDLGKK